MKTELKDIPGDTCPKSPWAGKNRGKHSWDYYVPEALPSGCKEMRRCISCGAMQALVEPAMTEGLPALKGWLDHATETRRIIEQNYSHLDPDAKLRATIKENVLVQLGHLRSHPAVDEGLKAGRLHLHGWVYHLESGEVASFDPEIGQFKPIGLSGVEAGEPLLGP